MIRAGRRMMIAAVRVTESEADAADAVQEAMIRLWRKRSDLASAENRIAYAVKVASHCAFDIVRSRHPADSINDINITATETDVIDERDTLANVLRYIDALPSPQREVLTMRHLEGMEINEIQEQLNLSAGNIRVILSRGRSALRKHFEI